MEPHPVPQDILNIDFKLFGAFSLNQFVKMIAGCLIGLFFFLLPIPILIKLPLMIGPIIIGVGIAMLPRFAEKFENFVKAIFISPRYIWVKESQSPSFLKGRSKSKSKDGQSKQKAQNKFNLEEISLDRMLAARDKSPEVQRSNIPIPKDKFDLEPREQNLDRVYENVFEDVKTNQAQPVTQQTKQPQPQQKVQQTITTQARTAGGQTHDEIKAKILDLKKQLAQIVKDQQHKEKEAEILSQINDLYHDLKMSGLDDVSLKDPVRQINKTQPEQQKLTTFQGDLVNKGQVVYGMVVDKKNKAIANADIFFYLQDSEKDLYVKTDSQGRFNSNQKIAPGEYEISISHPEHKFHSYKIKVTDQKLPAYKLRSR